MQVPDHNEIEAWVLKWTFTAVFFGVCAIFIIKMTTLVGTYVSSGKVIKDIGGFTWKILTTAPEHTIKGGNAIP